MSTDQTCSFLTESKSSENCFFFIMMMLRKNDIIAHMKMSLAHFCEEKNRRKIVFLAATKLSRQRALEQIEFLIVQELQFNISRTILFV